MIRRLLCLLGFHDFIDCCNDGKCFLKDGFVNGDCYNCEYGHGHNIICKYCGKELNKMTDLTDKWKKGELIEGEEYWVILTDEWYQRNPVEPVRAFYSCECEFEGYLDDDIEKVLAPVPSYEEWQAVNELEKVTLKDRAKVANQLVELQNKNRKLKELLKEVLRHELSLKEISELTRKICQALGEDK